MTSSPTFDTILAMYQLRQLSVPLCMFLLATFPALFGCAGEATEPAQLELPAGGFGFVETNLRACVGEPFDAQLEVLDQALGPINERRRDQADEGSSPPDFTTSDIFSANPSWDIIGASVSGGGPAAGPQASTGPNGEPGQTESRQFECKSVGMSEIWAYVPGGARYVASAKMDVNCVDCSPSGGQTGGSDPVNDCKEDSVGFKACPADLLHVDLQWVSAVRDAAGVTITAKSLAPIPKMPVGRVDISLVLEDANGSFLDALRMRSRGGAPFLPPTADVVTLGENDGIVISDEGEAIFRTSQELLDMLPGEVGRYYVEIGDDNADGANPYFDRTELFDFPLPSFN